MECLFPGNSVVLERCEAGFSIAIQARLAPSPEQDPTRSMHDARHSMVYGRPSTVANANGNRMVYVVDPRTGESITAEVNLYQDLMSLMRDLYFTQASPLDARAQSLPLPANATPQQRARADAARLSDAPALLRGELIELQQLVQNATTRSNDPMTRLHLRDLDLEITRILDSSR